MVKVNDLKIKHEETSWKIGELVLPLTLINCTELTYLHIQIILEVGTLCNLCYKIFNYTFQSKNLCFACSFEFWLKHFVLICCQV